MHISHEFISAAVKETNTNSYVLGQYNRASSNEYPYQKTFVKYNSGISSETIYMDGPTTVPLSVQVYLLFDPVTSASTSPTISVEYYSPDSITPVTPEKPNHWMTSEGPCSVTCGNDEKMLDIVQNTHQVCKH